MTLRRRADPNEWTQKKLRGSLQRRNRAKITETRAGEVSMKHFAGYKWVLVGILLLVSALNYGDRIALSAVFPMLKRDLGVTDLELGFIGSAFLWAYGLGCPFAGFLADRFSRARIIVTTLALWSVATLAVAYVRDLRELLAARVFLGIAECAYIPAALALIADHHGPSTRGVAISLNLAGMSGGMIAASSLAGYIAQTWGWRPAFSLLGWFGLALAAVAALTVRDTGDSGARESAPREAVSMRTNLALLARTRTYHFVLLQSMLNSAGVWMFWQWLPLYYQETYKLSLAGAGFSGTFMLTATALLGILLGGYASDRVGKEKPLRRPLIMAICYFCAAPILLIFLAQPGYVLLSASVALFSLVRSFGQANENLILCDLLAPRERSTALGVFLFANVGAGSIAILVAAWLRGIHGLGFAFACISGMVLLAAFSAFAVCRFMPGDLARGGAPLPTPGPVAAPALQTPE
jgi:predicted MFS family arabinose efflux permease